jgi:hypothetical protein
VAPISNIIIKIKSVILIFFIFTEIYNADAVNICGNSRNFGPEINCNNVGEQIINKIKKLNLFF